MKTIFYSIDVESHLVHYSFCRNGYVILRSKKSKEIQKDRFGDSLCVCVCVCFFPPLNCKLIMVQSIDSDEY